MACESSKECCELRENHKLRAWTERRRSGYKSFGGYYGKLCRPGPGLVKERCSAVWAVLPQDVFTDKPAVVTVGAGDEEEDLPSTLHAAQPGLDGVRAGLQVAGWVPLHTGEVRPCILCTKTQTQLDMDLKVTIWDYHAL